MTLERTYAAMCSPADLEQRVKRMRLDAKKIEVPAWLPDNDDTRADLVEYYEACTRFDQGVGFMLCQPFV